MNSQLKQISEKAIELADFEFTQEQTENKWLGTKPASETEIKLTEKRLGIKLPTDYKEFLRITNGFSAPNDIEPTFEQIEQIDYLKNIDSFLIEVWNEDGIADIGKQLERSILIAGISEEQYFLLIPPKTDSENWNYWKFSSWQPGEVKFNDLRHYLNDALEFINECIESE
nr:SMI1/KNR4 family protein [uncultured Psychroserpens sp.]